MNKRFLLLLSFMLYMAGLTAQPEMNVPEPPASKVAGYHVGVVQIIFGIHGDETTFLDKNTFYTIGFPMGITLSTGGNTRIDLEVVPVVKPFINAERPYEVHLLYHPGILFPMKKGWTFGMRLAFEAGQGQFGFTPLLNKAFTLKGDSVFFLELVAPGRFGPDKNSGYTQLGGLHFGFGF